MDIRKLLKNPALQPSGSSSSSGEREVREAEEEQRVRHNMGETEPPAVPPASLSGVYQDWRARRRRHGRHLTHGRGMDYHH